MKNQSANTRSTHDLWTGWLATTLVLGSLPTLAIEANFPITEDTYLDSRPASQASNFGLNNSVRVLVNSDTSVTRGLFAIPTPLRAYQPEEIREARVYFYVFQDNTQTRDIRLYPLTTPFLQGAGGVGATWLTADGTNNWTTPGGDWDASQAVTGTKEPVLDPDLNDRFFSWDITGLLTNALTRSNLLTHGAILLIDESPVPSNGSDRAPFTSSDSQSNPPEYRPRITVKLTPHEPVLNLVQSSPDTFRLDIANARPMLPHRIERTFDLSPPVIWTEVITLQVTGTETNWTEAVLGAPTNVFYRVGIRP